MKCCHCDIEITTQAALAGEVTDTDEGPCHIECLEPGDVMIEPKLSCDYDIPISDEVAEAQRMAYLGALGVRPDDYDRADDEIRAAERRELDTPIDPDRL